MKTNGFAMKYYLLWNHFKHVPTLITEKRGLCMSFPIWYADIEHGETFTARATHQKQIQERHWSKARLLLIKSTGINKILQESYQQEKNKSISLCLPWSLSCPSLHCISISMLQIWPFQPSAHWQDQLLTKSCTHSPLPEQSSAQPSEQWQYLTV